MLVPNSYICIPPTRQVFITAKETNIFTITVFCEFFCENSEWLKKASFCRKAQLGYKYASATSFFKKNVKIGVKM